MNTCKDMNSDEELISVPNILRFVILSLIGIFIYFVPITISGKSTILLDHIISIILLHAPTFASLLTLSMIVLGGIQPFYDKSWKKDIKNSIMSGFKIIGLILAICTFVNIGPEWLLRDDILPFIIKKIVTPVALIIPLGSLFLTFLTNSGLIGFLGVLLKPVMIPIWKVPGIAAVNVVTSFIGSFSVGIFMTNKLFMEGRYTKREATIITTGFSTVSVAFMVIIAKNLDLMESWNAFFWTTLVVTFLVTAITVRLKPLRSIEDVYISNIDTENKCTKEGLIARSFKTAIYEVKSSDPLLRSIINNFKDGILMSLRLLPLITAVGTISFLLVKMSPVFDLLAFFYYPIVSILRLPEPWSIAQASATAGTEVLVPSIIMANVKGTFAARFVTGVVSISSILFFSGSIPCILATDIDIDVKTLIIIHIQRTVITLVIVAPIVKFLF